MTIELVKLPIYKEYHQFFSFNIAQQIFFSWLTSVSVANSEWKIAKYRMKWVAKKIFFVLLYSKIH